MKLDTIRIQDFRSITDLSLSFRDELGLFRNRIPIVGPNTTGKTTILDAIALCLMPVTEIYRFREGLRLTPSSLVRRGAIQASVTSVVWFSDEEIEATREVIERAGNPFHKKVPQANFVTVHWTYPDPLGKHRAGYYRCEPQDGWLLFRGRKILAMNLHVPNVSSRGFLDLGHVVMFDQQRTGLARRIHPRERSLLGQMVDPDLTEDIQDLGSEDAVSSLEGRRGQFTVVETSDPRIILTSLAARAQVRQDPEATEEQAYTQLCQLYERVCRPHRIVGLYNTEHGLDMEFMGDRGVYYYDGLSSGQQMILLLLLQFATRRIHRSIVLIDEIELHLHPLWQDRLFESLGELGKDNQFIFTTHSTHLRDSIREQKISTGDLKA
jgi:energy-coupling factor transporter ATP-binding protein EcfA2